MVRILNDNNNQDDAVTQQLFLSSLKTWYPNGIPCRVERIGKVFTTKFSKDPQIPITIITTGTVNKMRARVIGEDGKAIRVYDEVTDEHKPKIELLENPENVSVTFFYKMKHNPKSADEDEDEYIINNKSNTFPLLNYGFIRAGELPTGNEQSFACTWEEIDLALSKLEFLAGVETRSYNKRDYNCLIASDLDGGDDPTKKSKSERVTPSTSSNVIDGIPSSIQAGLSENSLLKGIITQLNQENMPITEQSILMELNFRANDNVATPEEIGAAKDTLFNLI